MKVYISTDMEGITGIVDWGQVTFGDKEFDAGRKLMTGDTNAAIEGALAAGATDIVVNDAHGSKRNLILEELHPAAQLITGRIKAFTMMAGIDEKPDVALFIGYHARAGSMYAVLNHTWYTIVHDVTLNGTPVGEFGLNAAIAGHYGVPVAMVSGDQAVVKEAQDLVGDQIEAVVVKHAYGMNAARCLTPARTRPMIREAAERAVKKGAKPLVLDTPITLTVTYQTTMQAQIAALVPGGRYASGRTVEFTGSNMFDVYQAFRAMCRLAASAR